MKDGEKQMIGDILFCMGLIFCITVWALVMTFNNFDDFLDYLRRVKNK